jgi:hypothetical protein
VGRELARSIERSFAECVGARAQLTRKGSGSYDESEMRIVRRSPRVSGQAAIATSHKKFVGLEGEMTRSTLKFAATALVLGVSLFSSATVFAQEETRSSDGEGGGYGYEFTDDPLNAGGFGPNDATIRVRPGPVRTTLIRPRTSFVNEMLKSVENL